MSAPKVAKRNEPVADWTLDHWHRLVTGMGDVQHGIGYVLAAGCALRRGEVAGLRWGDVDAEGATVRVERAVQVVGHSTRVAAPKTESGKRTVPLMPAVAEALESWRRVQRDALLAHGIRVTNSTPILTWITGGRSRGGQRPSEVGAPVHPQTLAAGCAKACEALGTPVVGLHGLRHVCITLGLTPREAGGFGWSPSVGAAFAGHADETITLRTYTHLSQRSVAAAVQDGYVRRWLRGHRRADRYDPRPRVIGSRLRQSGSGVTGSTVEGGWHPTSRTAARLSHLSTACPQEHGSILRETVETTAHQAGASRHRSVANSTSHERKQPWPPSHAVQTPPPPPCSRASTARLSTSASPPSHLTSIPTRS
ncbi:MAG: site-specific integrase [Acidimicrobiaceae bacterium]|nr:site-specific integrase [Acidimicrobiaceae bacterium]